jgi:hypothetical protein
VAEVKQAGQSQRRKAGIVQALPRRRQARKLGIGGGQNDDVARALAKIHRFAAIADSSWCGG